MAYIAPNTNIRILQGVPLNNKYEDTLYFDSRSAQSQYFISKTKPGQLYTAQSYQRYARNKLRIACTPESLYDCNYLMFQNASFGDKWFYAFLVQTEYVNNNTTEVTYEIDVMQTWFFDYSFKQCFIDRQHTTSDDYFEWILDEGLDVGDYCWGPATPSPNFIPLWNMTIASENVFEDETDKAYVTVLNNNYVGGVAIIARTLTEFKTLVNKLNDTGKMDSVIACYMIPKPFGEEYVNNDITYNTFKTMSVPVYLGTFNGYTPKNKKLYCYPFNFLVVDAIEESKVLKYELFNIFSDQTQNLTFREYCTILPNPVGVSVPVNYEGANLDTNALVACDTTNAVSLSNFPICGMATDSYKAWVAQNSNQMKTDFYGKLSGNILKATVGSLEMMGGLGLMATGVGAGAGIGLLGAGVGSVASAGIDTAGYVTNQMAMHDDRKMTPDRHTGSESSDVASMTGARTFRYRNRHVNYEYAKRIDNYFTMYGYKINQIGVPNINARPHFTYIKTVGCIIQGNVPAEEAQAICNIHDKGIRYWKGGTVGNYNVDNSPT